MSLHRPEPRTPTDWPENTEPSVQQIAAWLLICTDAEREWYVKLCRHNATEAGRCFMEDHDRRLASPRTRWWTPTGLVSS